MPERFEAQIRMLPMFANLPDQYMDWARDAMHLMRFEQGETVFEQGDPSKGLYMFLQGSARLLRQQQDGTSQQLGVIGQNQYLNEAALHREGRETATLEVLETSLVLFISRQQLKRVITHHPEMKEYITIPVEAARAQQREKIFRGQRESEKVLMDTRRHWWLIVRRAWIPVLVGGLLLVAAAFMPSAGLSLGVGGLGIVVAGLLMLYLYLEWRNDHVIVTDQRIIRIEQVIHEFNTQISEIPLSSIQQINADIVTTDPFSRLFNYGMVDIRTAGDAGNMRLRLMPNPDGVQNLIFENLTNAKQEQDSHHRKVIRAELDKALSGSGDEQTQDPESEAVPPVDPEPPRGFFSTRYVNAQGETIYRKHVIFWARSMFWPLVVLLGSLALLPFAGELGTIGYVLNIGLIIVAFLWAWWVDWDWRNDMYAIGDEMIQIIHKRPLFLQNEDDQVLLDRVDNVSMQKNGLLPALLNYGMVSIALVGSDKGDKKYFTGVPNPAEVQAEVTRRQSRWRAKQDMQEARQRREEIADYIAVYNERQGAQQGGAPQQQGGGPQQSGMPQNSAPQQRSAPPQNNPPQGGGRPPRDNNRPPNVPRRRNS